MYPLKHKIILILLLIITAILFLYLAYTTLMLSKSDFSYIYNLIPYIVIFSTILIILSPVIFGINVIWAIMSVSCVAISFISINVNKSAYNLQIPIIVFISFIVHLFYKQKFAVVEKDITATQKITESTNVLKSLYEKTDALNDALTERLERYRNLRHIGESFSTNLSLEEICRLAVDTSFSMIPSSDAALLFLVDEAQQKFVLSASKVRTELPRVKSKNGDIFDQWVFKEQQSLSVEDLEEDFRFDYKPLDQERAFNSLISVPLTAQSRMIGILRLNSKEKSAYTFDDLRLLDFISDLVSSAINNARLYEKTEELSTKDSLTGFYIHRYMKERLKEEVDRARINSSLLSVIMIDIDHFKDYNDKYGHSAGDKVLLRIAKIIGGKLRNGQIIARYGGEEFAILLPGTDKDKATKIAEDIRKEVETSKFVLRRKETKVTISAGVSTYTDDIKDNEELLKRSDFCLYQAKKQGRNKVCVV